MDDSTRAPYPINNNDASIEASVSASSGELTKDGTRANEHPKTVDMTDSVMSINLLSSLLRYNQDSNPINSPLGTPKVAQNNDGELVFFKHNKPKGATDIRLSSSPFQ